MKKDYQMKKEICEGIYQIFGIVCIMFISAMAGRGFYFSLLMSPIICNSNTSIVLGMMFASATSILIWGFYIFYYSYKLNKKKEVKK